VIKKLSRYAVVSLLAMLFAFIPSTSFACGHEGVYVGAGYMQLFMYTPEKQLNSYISERIKTSPGYGATALVGYDFKGTRWGIQAPFEFSRFKLNKSEWVNYYGMSIEAVFHIIEWQSGLEIHMVGGGGWAYLSEGHDYNNSRGHAVTADLGPGLSYYFSMTEKVSASIALEIPFRFTHFFGDHLSRSGTSFAAFPVRLMFEVGF